MSTDLTINTLQQEATGIDLTATIAIGVNHVCGDRYWEQTSLEDTYECRKCGMTISFMLSTFTEEECKEIQIRYKECKGNGTDEG